MKIITWNCQGAYRKKAHLIAETKPDIAIIQECEPLEKLSFKPDCPPPFSSYWFGDSKKGIGVFSYTNYDFQLSQIYDPRIRHCIPLRVSGKHSFNMIATWAMNHPDKQFSYIGQIYLAINQYRSFIQETDTIITGDFNSNVIWDRSAKPRNMGAVIRELEMGNMTSVYHHYFQEKYGRESKNTLFMYRKKEKGYHIDYCFVPKSWLPNLQYVEVGTYEQWTTVSDHSPLIVEFERE